MRVVGVELRRITLPLVAPFRTFHGIERDRHAVLVRVLSDGPDGWGECVAMSEPTYTSEYADGAEHVLRHHLLPRIVGQDVTAEGVLPTLAGVKGHPMAKASVEMAVLDAELRRDNRSFADRLGATRDRVPSGISLGLDATIDDVADAVADGYRRVKLKIAPGADIAPVRAAREAFPALLLQVDANGAYTLDDADHLAALDDLDLLLIEQPLAEDDLAGHAALARRLRTPICLDESITSAATASAAITAGACEVVNLKAGRVGGYLEAVRVHDVCVAADVPLWCGGMLETGLGRAANIALAALPGFTLPGDLSASDRWYAEDLTEPFVLDDGDLIVPSGPGLGVEPRPDVLRRVTTSVELVQ